MQNRLYVTHLPFEPNRETLRALFARCGKVFDLALVADRTSGRPRAAALVTYSTEGEARRAIADLDGVTYEGQRLRVMREPDRTPPPEQHGSSRGKPPEVAAPARITQQFREAANMTYELDCAGTPLVLRMFFPATGPTAEWRIDARTHDAPDVSLANASAASRTQALRAIAVWWTDSQVSHRLAPIDWRAVEQALETVRAL
jgi:RNA recognition motif-containing protein